MDFQFYCSFLYQKSVHFIQFYGFIIENFFLQ